MPNFKKSNKGYMMQPKGMGGQAYTMMGGQDPKKKKTKMVDLVPKDKSGKPIPQVTGGAGLFGYIGGGGLKAVGKMFKAFTKAPKQYMKSASKNVPVIGKPGKTVKVPKSSKTKQVSYVNPRISMTAAERAKAGY
jgi:hypothetical protein